MAGVRRGAFTYVGWKVTLCDPIWQLTSRSSEMGLYLFYYIMRQVMQTLAEVVDGHRSIKEMITYVVWYYHYSPTTFSGLEWTHKLIPRDGRHHGRRVGLTFPQ